MTSLGVIIWPQDRVELIGCNRASGIGVGGEAGLLNAFGCEDNVKKGATLGTVLEVQTGARNKDQNDEIYIYI